MNQQVQALDYFKINADDWQNKASAEGFCVIDNRHNAVLEVMSSYANNGVLLDVGCGTGQLAIEASKRNWKAIGVDFSSEMIDLCVANNLKEKTHAEFHCDSIFNYEMAPKSYDVISAQGFIEYISLEQLDRFIELCSASLKVGGALVLGSRNRLFNLHSLNEFTSLELGLGTVDHLLRESIILQTAKTQAQALNELFNLGYEYSQPEVHPDTGIKVDTRYQFSPADLISRLKKHNLIGARIFPAHFHALPLSVTNSDDFASLHDRLANMVSKEHITLHNIVPYSSSFIIEARLG